MAGIITLKFTIMKNGISDLGMKSPIFHQGPVEPQFGPGRYLTFEGFSVDEKGKQHYMDATVAYRQTTLRVIEYLRRFGYDDYQVYLLLSCAPVQGHIAGIVDVSSNVCFFSVRKHPFLCSKFCCAVSRFGGKKRQRDVKSM